MPTAGMHAIAALSPNVEIGVQEITRGLCLSSVAFGKLHALITIACCAVAVSRHVNFKRQTN